jgi:hypothetical protein
MQAWQFNAMTLYKPFPIVTWDITGTNSYYATENLYTRRWIRRTFPAQQFWFGENVFKKFCFSCAPVRAGIEDEISTTCHLYNLPLQPLFCA